MASAIELLGWIAAAIGMSLGLPQLVRLWRTRDTKGISLLMWQLMLSVNLGWMFHGLRIWQLNMVIANAFSLLTTVLVLRLLARDLRRRIVWLALPGVVVAAVLMLTEVVGGGGAFGAAALVPAVVAGIGQSVELVGSPQIGGVAPVYLIVATLNQGAWLSWGLLVPEVSTIIAATVTGSLALFNVIWWTLRRLGLPSIGRARGRSLPEPTS